MQGKVSMVVPCYNKVDYIGKMLESVYNQLWDNIELILVNDGSTDGTREIIGEWEPKLIDRGFDVKIIDQANGGCCAAVYNGLLAMTGDYYCLVDADDEIMPEYCSTMAGFLDENTDYQWTMCSYKRQFIKNGEIADEIVYAKDSYEDYRREEAYILGKIPVVVWIYMSRVDYLKECGFIENFCYERRKTYEDVIAIPLLTGNGKLKAIDEALYFHYDAHLVGGISSTNSIRDVQSFYDDHLYMRQWAINRLDIPDDRKDKLLRISNFTTKLDGVWRMFDLLDKNNDNKDIQYELENMMSDTLKLTGFDLDITGKCDKFFYRVVRDALLNAMSNKPMPDLKINDETRFILWGVLGKSSSSLLPKILSYITADKLVLWDKGVKREGVAVVSPDISTVTENDVIVILPLNHFANQIEAECSNIQCLSVLKGGEFISYLAFTKGKDSQDKAIFEAVRRFINER